MSQPADEAIALEDVFGISSKVQRSYVDRGGLDRSLREALDRGDRHVVIHGDSKQGKSWLRKRHLPADSSIVIQCEPSSTVASLFKQALGVLGIASTLKTTTTGALEGTIASEAKFDIGNSILAKLGMRVKGSATATDTSTTETQPIGQSPADLYWVARIIVESEKRLVFEDFHYLPEPEQRTFSTLLKSIGEYDVFPIIVGVWPEDHRLTYHNGELDGRLSDICLSWPPDELKAVLEAGCTALNIGMSPGLQTELITDAYGNVGLLQRLTAKCCELEGIRNRQQVPRYLTSGVQLLEARQAIAGEMKPRYDLFGEAMDASARKLPGATKDQSLYALKTLTEAGEAELMQGVASAAVFDGMTSAVSERDARIILQDMVAMQVGDSRIRPPVFAYSMHVDSVKLVDTAFLFFRKYGQPRWFWDDDA